MFCTKCGSHLLERAMFCIKCGKAIEKRVLEKKGAAAFSAIMRKEAEEFTRLTVEKYELLHIKVAGASLSGNTESRQTILRKIKFHDAEFEDEIDVRIKESEVDGYTTFGVYANEQLIGNVPKCQVQYLKDNWNRIDKITHIEVFGGTKLHNQKRANYGAEITVRLHRQGAYTWLAPFACE